MNPSNNRRLPVSPEEWLDHAESDFRLARLAAGTPEIRREQVCFHAQQAAEKAIKAVLVSRGIEFPLTHDLAELLEIARNGGLDLPEEVMDAELLTPFAVETRYPGFQDEITAADVDDALQIAERTLAWTKNLAESSSKKSK